jgi:hypothetical protein
MERACAVAAESIFLAACTTCPDHVLFTVTHDGCSGSDDMLRSGTSASPSVGIDSIPEPHRSHVLAELNLGIGAGSPAAGGTSYMMHGRQSRRRHGGGSSGGGGAAVAPMMAAPSGWRGFQRAVALTEALGGHIGIKVDAARGFTRIWVLLPRAPHAWDAVRRPPSLGGREVVYRTFNAAIHVGPHGGAAAVAAVAAAAVPAAAAAVASDYAAASTGAAAAAAAAVATSIGGSGPALHGAPPPGPVVAHHEEPDVASESVVFGNAAAAGAPRACGARRRALLVDDEARPRGSVRVVVGV